MVGFDLEKTIQEVMLRYGFHSLGDAVHIPEAENGLVHRVTFDGKDYMVKKMHRNTRLSDISYINAFTLYMKQWIPEVAVLEKTTDGQFYVGQDGAYIVVGKWLPGTKARSFEPWLVKAVAGLLARLHRYSLEWPEGRKRVCTTTLEDLDWENNSMFERETVTRVLLEDPSPMYETAAPGEKGYVDDILAKRDLIFREYAKMAEWTANLANSGKGQLKAVIHGDIYPSNLLWDHEQLTGILDWDSCQYEPLVYELGRVMWEFCKDKTKGTIDPARSDLFLSTYCSAGGPVPEDEMNYMIPYIRLLRITEILFYVQNSTRGDYWSASYTAENLRALENLPE
jgi:Ser/Thr protein kinase RdoA (MazF antagonist)